MLQRVGALALSAVLLSSLFANSGAKATAPAARPTGSSSRIRRAGGEARGRGGLGQTEVAMTDDQRRSLYILLAAVIAGGSIAFLSMWWFG